MTISIEDINRKRQESSTYGSADTANRTYTIEDIYALPDGVRAELMDGKLYNMATPTRSHQKAVGEMHLAVANFIRSHGKNCEVYLPRFPVFPFNDEKTYLEPDLTVVCDLDKLDEKGCHGAPDWVVEVVSPSSRKLDHHKKFVKYFDAGVREYWIVQPDKRTVFVHIFDSEANQDCPTIYSFEDSIPSYIFPELTIRLADYL